MPLFAPVISVTVMPLPKPCGPPNPLLYRSVGVTLQGFVLIGWCAGSCFVPSGGVESMSTNSPPTGRPRAFDTETVLDRAAEVFWQRGYEGASLSALTTAVGINRPSLYAAFGSKQELFRRTFTRYHDAQVATARAALDQPTAYASVEAFLRTSADGLTAANPPPGCLSIQGGLACAPENAPISQALATGRAA